MIHSKNRILLVEDDVGYRQMLECALVAEGFECDHADNGADAASLLTLVRYDLLLTDLQMPICNGHALAVEVLTRHNRPAIVALTGVVEPRLAADLLARGVEDVIFKPIEFKLLAAKLKALLASRCSQAAGACADKTACEPLVCMPDLATRLLNVSHIFPIPAGTLEIARMSADSRYTAEQVADALAAAPALAIEVLRLANSRCFASAGRKTGDLNEAVKRIGLRRVGEIALAAEALQGIAERICAWMDLKLLCRQSYAAATALRMLMRSAGLRDDGGLVLAALVHGLGRVVLDGLYPEIYNRLARECAESKLALLQLEKRAFPHNHAQVMAELLTQWGLQSGVCTPLRHVLSTFQELHLLNEPLRSKVELCKLAIWIGRVAAGRWERWDTIEPAPGSILAKFGLRSLDEILGAARAGIEEVGPRSIRSDMVRPTAEAVPESGRHASYTSLSSPRGDLLPHVLASMGLAVHPFAPEDIAVKENVIINCIGVPAKRLAPYLGSGVYPAKRCIFSDAAHIQEHQAIGLSLELPGSYAAFSDACYGVASEMANASTS
jgi:HD-like signal output (HDOD) protein/CheY-like chemotaxis protein